jgi:hypothetical protein
MDDPQRNGFNGKDKNSRAVRQAGAELSSVRHAFQGLFAARRRAAVVPNPVDSYELDKNLQYKLVIAIEAIEEEFGEVTNRDIVLLVESWIMAQTEKCMPLVYNPAYFPFTS